MIHMVAKSRTPLMLLGMAHTDWSLFCYSWISKLLKRLSFLYWIIFNSCWNQCGLFFFLDSTLSIDLFVCLNSTILSWLLQFYHESWNQVVLIIQFCFLFQSCLVIVGPMSWHANFRINFWFLQKIHM